MPTEKKNHALTVHRKYCSNIIKTTHMNAKQETPSISSDDTKDFFLYVYKGEKNSEEALSILRRNPTFSSRCGVKDISMLPDIPAFLQGVPTMYVKKTKLVLCGTKCLKSIEEQQKKELKPMNQSMTSNYQPAPGKKESPDKYGDGKVSDDALQSYLARRG